MSFELKALKLRRFLKQAIHLFAYAYLGLIVGYFILRLIVWDKLWVVGLLSTFIPYILFPLFLLPVLAFSVVKKRWFLIISSIACILLLSWLHVKYWSPQQINSSNSQASIKVLSLNSSWYKTRSEALVNLVLKEQPDIICLQEIVDKHTQRAFRWLKASYPYQVGTPPVGILSRYQFCPLKLYT